MTAISNIENNNASVHSSKLGDEKKTSQFILFVTEEQKDQKKGTYKNDIFKFCEESFS